MPELSEEEVRSRFRKALKFQYLVGIPAYALLIPLYIVFEQEPLVWATTAIVVSITFKVMARKNLVCPRCGTYVGKWGRWIWQERHCRKCKVRLK